MFLLSVVLVETFFSDAFFVWFGFVLAGFGGFVVVLFFPQREREKKYVRWVGREILEELEKEKEYDQKILYEIFIKYAF